MFRFTNKSTQTDMFSSANSFLTGRSLKKYENPMAWHNMFRIQVTHRIDEGIFRPLFCSDNGRNISSIRVLVSMMILKEANGWSDEQLFEECRYNLLIRSALGLFNMDDSVAAESTYYLFRKRVVEWEKTHNENLIEKVFSQITKSQVVEFQVSGKNIRMDSKLMGSNIAWYSRYELVHETLRKAIPCIHSEMGRLLLCESDITLLESINKETGDKVSYRSNKSEIELKMAELGAFIHRIISQLVDNPSESIQTLRRVFNEQYQYQTQETCVITRSKEETKPDSIQLPQETASCEITHSQEENVQSLQETQETAPCVLTRPKSDIKADSVQSPHDTECSFRQKGENQYKGYCINLTETSDKVTEPSDKVTKPSDKVTEPSNKENILNLITHVQVGVASTADCNFLKPAVESTQEIVPEKIEIINADGAFHSVDNQNYCKENTIDLILGAIQGKPPRYDLSFDEKGELVVTDLQTNTIVPSRKIEPRKKKDQLKWAIKDEEGKYRYFTQKEIDTSLLRKQIGARTPEELNVRNNVEATIFQLGYHYPNDKSRYRGLIKHKIWANVRCLWINFVRILNFLTRRVENCAQKVTNQDILRHFFIHFSEMLLTMRIVVNFCSDFANNGFWAGFEKRDFS